VTLQGKSAIVTGASRGFGRLLAARLAGAGANLLITARTADDLDSLCAQLRPVLRPDQAVVAQVADSADPDTGERLVAECLAAFGRLDVVVGNAAQLGPIGTLGETRPEDWAAVFACNLFGPMRLCRAAIEPLSRQPGGRIILMSGGGATGPLPGFSAYGASKTALVRFAETLALELAGKAIAVNAVAPGVLDTAMTRTILAAGPGRVGADYLTRLTRELARADETLSEALALCAFLCGRESEGITGKLISARWDDWRQWPQARDRLMASDVYTLRRVVGRDRDFAEGDRS
jgi:NAD(P)-dependent dehydrogenase (short-subunit alcohol dehydrogenase family)